MKLWLPVKIHEMLITLACLVFIILPTAFAGKNDKLLVFAPASLSDSLNAVVSLYQQTQPHDIRVSYAASSTLARQIEAGAPVDIYLSANELWMDYLQNRGLIEDASRTSLLSNRLVLISPASQTITLNIMKDIPLTSVLNDRRLAMADPDHVPAGQYAREALTNLGVWDLVKGKVARTDNVRAALALVSLGESPLGIVYKTDTRTDAHVTIVDTFPEHCHTPIIYSAALIRDSTSQTARSFMNYLKSLEANKVFRRFGFTTPHNP